MYAVMLTALADECICDVKQFEMDDRGTFYGGEGRRVYKNKIGTIKRNQNSKLDYYYVMWVRSVEEIENAQVLLRQQAMADLRAAMEVSRKRLDHVYNSPVGRAAFESKAPAEPAPQEPSQRKW